jgi:hypothetical protein
MYKIHHQKGDTDRLYVKGKGKRGLLLIKAPYKAETITTVKYS